jgi:cyanophycin synthetase
MIYTGETIFWRLLRYYREKRVAQLPAFVQLRNKFYRDLWQKAASEISANFEVFDHELFRISKDGRATFVQESRVQLDDQLSLRIAGNKPLVYRIMTENGYQMQPFLEYNMSSLAKAEDFLNNSGGACVVKPAAGTGAGNGVTTQVETVRELRKASVWAATFHRKLLIEKDIPGASFRLLYLNGEFIDAVRRDPPTVTGDGRHTIRQLIYRENQRRLSDPVIAALSPIMADVELVLHLNKSGYHLGKVLQAGEQITIKKVCNQNRRDENHTVRQAVHPEIIETGKKITELFGLKLAGVDVITSDISRPLSETCGVINEVNTNPGLHHHYLIANPENGVPVARMILEQILKVGRYTHVATN